jgi:hypothetical protein
MNEVRLDRQKLRAAPVYRQPSTARDATRVSARVDLARLESRDLREVEDVMHVHA